MLPAYDQSSTWVLPTACVTAKVNDACPKGSEIAFKTFPAALAWFLIDAGYPYWNQTPGAADPNRAPTFDCARVTSVNLKLVCATPELAASDRTLAALYAAAVSATPDATALRASENAWLVQRNQAPPDIDLLKQLYASRIAELTSSTPQENAAARPPTAAPAYSPAYQVGPAQPPEPPQHLLRPVPGANGYRPYTPGTQFVVPPRPLEQSPSHPHQERPPHHG